MRPVRILASGVAVIMSLGGLAACGDDDSSTTGSGDFDAKSYFAGKTIRVIVNTDAGTGTDLYARFIAPELSDALPGHPRISVTNIDALGGTSSIYDAPEKDLVLGVSSRASAIYTTASDPAATHDPSKIRIIGGIQGDTRAWTGFGDIVDAWDSLADASGQTSPKLRMAGSAGSPEEIESDLFLFPWLCEKLDLPCEYVKVATDTSTDVALMIERGEVNLLAGRTVSSIRTNADAIEDGDAKILFNYAPNDNVLHSPDGSDIPDIESFLPEDAKAEYEAILPIISSGNIGNPLWTGPAMPDEAVGALRDAFAEVMTDDDTVAQVALTQSGADPGEKSEYTIIPVTGDDAQAAFAKSAKSFADNASLYTDLQQHYFDDYWG